ncbi:Hypothetical predicted protein [Olea europaea subsp. europaea]|uniref:Uncharacterized protein n=1 Tax=Olea europaea subsp. europaea TaxID=158383 RepID=A0A8S0V7J4_OLEEU|nr:Hypothetical predicted protein [Olea europaea subsp. europaea]
MVSKELNATFDHLKSLFSGDLWLGHFGQQLLWEQWFEFCKATVASYIHLVVGGSIVGNLGMTVKGLLIEVTEAVAASTALAKGLMRSTMRQILMFCCSCIKLESNSLQ